MARQLLSQRRLSLASARNAMVDLNATRQTADGRYLYVMDEFGGLTDEARPFLSEACFNEGASKRRAHLPGGHDA